MSVLNLGSQRIPDFTDPDTPLGPLYPLHLMVCQNCTLLQLDETVPRSAFYHDRYGSKSGISEAIKSDLRSVVDYALEIVPQPQTWLDIGCNDGTLMAMLPAAVNVTGIDPLPQFASEARQYGRIIIDYFTPGYFNEGAFDVVTSISVFYDLENPNELVQGVGTVLSDRGVWVIQQNYALGMLNSGSIDGICHEHLTYFAVKPLQTLLNRHGLEINDVTYSPINGGCFRTVVSHQGHRSVSDSVRQALQAEEDAGLSRTSTYLLWASKMQMELAKTRNLLNQVRSEGKRCYLLGASTRGGTILQLINAGPALVSHAVERSPAKVGKTMAATGIPIISEEDMRADPPEYLLLSMWFFRDSFIEREKNYLDNGGHIIIPLSRFEVV